MYKWRSLNEAIYVDQKHADAWVRWAMWLMGLWRGCWDANMTYSKHILSCYPSPQTIKYRYNCNISSYKHSILYWDRHCLAKSNFQKRIHLIDIPWSWTCIASILSREKTSIPRYPHSPHIYLSRKFYFCLKFFSYSQMPTRKAIDKVQPGFLLKRRKWHVNISL